MIKEASDNDYPVLIRIWESAVLATHDFLSKKDFDHIKRQLPDYFDNVRLFVFIDDQEGNIRGFIGISEDKIEMLFIDNESRGKGIGKILIKYVVDELNIRKVDVNEQNTQALQFYEYLGFKAYDRSELDSEGKNYPIIYLSL